MASIITATYYHVVDTNYATHVYSTAAANYVVLADAGYVAWLATGETADTWDTQTQLFAFFAAAGYPSLIQSGYRVPTTNINGLLTSDLIRAYSTGTLEIPGGVTTDTSAANALSGFNNNANAVFSAKDSSIGRPAFTNPMSQYSGFGFPKASTVTMTLASPCVVTWVDGSHDLQINDSLNFRSTGSLPTGVTAGTTYYITAVPAANTFRFSATLGGGDVNSSVSQSGTHYCTLVGGSLVRSNTSGFRKEVLRFNNGVQLFDSSGTAATGGDKGFGTINVPTGYYINGSSIFTSPTLTTPVLGVATATSINKVTITAPATSATLTIADGKTFTVNAGVNLNGTDGKTLTLSNSGTLGGGDAFILSIAAGKTFTISNSLGFAGTDGTTMTFPAASAVVVGSQQLYATAAVDFNTTNTDYPITINLPSGYTKYRIGSITVINTGTAASLNTATCGVWTGAGETGTNLVASGAVLSGCTTSTALTASAVTQLTLAVANAYVTSSTTTIYFRMKTAQGAAASGTVAIQVIPIP